MFFFETSAENHISVEISGRLWKILDDSDFFRVEHTDVVWIYEQLLRILA